MPFNFKEDIMGMLKEGAGDGIVQYAFNKFAGDKISSKLGSLGKWADVGASLLYGIAVDFVADEVGGEFEGYLKHGSASQLGRSLSIAFGDPSIGARPVSPPTEQGVAVSGRSKFSTLEPVRLR